MKNETLTVTQACRKLGITIDAVYRAIRSGRLEATKRDGKFYIPGAAVEARLKAKQAREDA